VIVFGHRGAPGYPRYGENTISSFNKALRSGADGLEFDVRRCRDGRIVVIHDETIDRTTNGKGRVADLSYEELRRFDAGFGEPIPLLSDVLDVFGTKCLLNIEIKEREIVDGVRKLVLEKRLEKHVIVSDFEWRELATLTPEIPIALLSSKLENLIPAARQMGATAIHPRRDLVTASLIAAARQAKLRVHIWTVNGLDEISRSRRLGVDGIFTDFPERCSTSAS